MVTIKDNALVPNTPVLPSTPAQSAAANWTIPAKNAGVSSAVYGAAINSGLNTKNPVINNKTISGSPTIQQNNNAANTLANASKSIIPSGTNDVRDANGLLVNPPGATFDRNTGKPLNQTQNQPSQAPTIVSTSAPDASGGTYSTMSNGTSVYNPPNPATAGLYSQANNTKSTATAQYNNDVSAATSAGNAEVAQLEKQKADAMAGAEASYDTNNPEGSGSDKQTYAAGVATKYDSAIEAAKNKLQTNLSNLSIAHTSNLQNIDEQLQTGINTNMANIVSQGQTTLKELEKGDGTMSEYDKSTLIQQLTSGGMNYDQARLAVEGALQQGRIANDKTLTTEARQEQSVNAGILKSSLASVTDVAAAANDPVLQSLALKSGVAGNPAGYDTAGNPLFSTDQMASAKNYIETQTKSSVAANLAQQKVVNSESNALARIAIASENAAKTNNKATVDDINNSIKTYLSVNKDAFNVQTPAELADTISGIASLAGVEPTRIVGYVQALAKANPQVDKIVSSPNFIQKFFGTTTKTSTNVPNKDSSQPGGNSNSFADSSQNISIDGQNYSVGQQVQVQGAPSGITFTAQSDGSLLGSDGQTYQ